LTKVDRISTILRN